MRRLIILAFLFAALSVCSAENHAAVMAQNTSSATASSPAQESASPQANEAVIPIQLTRTLDAKKLKAGDPVSARITAELHAANGTVIPSGSMVKGHVVGASARSKGGSQSSLSLAFDNIVLKNGQQLPLKATIQAVGAPAVLSDNNGGSNGPMGDQPSMPSPGAPPPSAGGGPPMTSPTPMGGMNPSGGIPQSPSSNTQTAAGVGSMPSAPALTAQSRGVVGLRGLELQSDSTLTSSGKDLKLESGTEMILRVQDQ